MTILFDCKGLVSELSKSGKLRGYSQELHDALMAAKNWHVGKGSTSNIKMMKLWNELGSVNGKQQRSTPSTSRGPSRDQGTSRGNSMFWFQSQGCSWDPQKIKSHMNQWRREDPWWGSKESQRSQWSTEWQGTWNPNMNHQPFQPPAWQGVDNFYPQWDGEPTSASSAQNAVTFVHQTATVHVATVTQTSVTPQPPPQTQTDSPDERNAVTPKGSVGALLKIWKQDSAKEKAAQESIKKETTDETESVTENGAQSTEHGAQGSAGEQAQVDDNVQMEPIESEVGDWDLPASPAPSAVYEAVSDKEEDEAMAAATVRSHTPPVQDFANLSEFHTVAAQVTQGVAEASPEGNERRTRQRVQPPSLPLEPPPGLSVTFDEC